MTTLYGCKRTQEKETFLIAKFDEQLVIQSSYFVGQKVCQCPQWHKRKTCRHLTIRSMFMTAKHLDDGWFLDFDNRKWREYPQLMLDGTIGDFKERFDALLVGDGGYQPAQNSAAQNSEASKPQTLAASVEPEALSLSTSGSAPGVELPQAPPGVTIVGFDDIIGLHNAISEVLGEAPLGTKLTATPTIGGIKRRKGL